MKNNKKLSDYYWYTWLNIYFKVNFLITLIKKINIPKLINIENNHNLVIVTFWTDISKIFT